MFCYVVCGTMELALLVLLLITSGGNTSGNRNVTQNTSGLPLNDGNTTNESTLEEVLNSINFNKAQVEVELKDILASKNNNSTKVVEAFESTLSAQFARFEQNTKLTVGGVELYVVTVGPGNARSSGGGVQNITFDGNTGSVSFPMQQPVNARQQTIKIKAVVVKWNNFVLHQVATHNQSQHCTSITCLGKQPTNASLITVSYYDVTDPIKPQRLPLPVNYSVDTREDFTGLLLPFHRITSVERSCVWWNTGAWSSYGCQALYSDGGGMDCTCNHTTTFTTLLLLHTIDVPQWVIVTSQCLQSASIVFLALAIVLLMLARTSKGLDGVAYYCVGMRNNRSVSQVSLCVALIGLHVTTLVADLARYTTAACYTAAALQHIFLLASAFWLLNEGVAITLKTHVDLAFNINYKVLTVCQVAASWLVPVAIVAVSLGVFRHSYVQISPAYLDYLAKDTKSYKNYTGLNSYPMYNECWINSQDATAIYMAIVPVCMIVAVNICLIARLIYMVYRISKEDNTRQSNVTSQSVRRHSVTQQLERRAHWKSVVKSYCVLFPISTLPWVFSLLGMATVEFIGIHAVINGFQGVGVFLVFCVFGEDDRTRLLRLWKRGQQRYGRALHPRTGARGGVARTLKVPPSKGRGDGGRGSNTTVMTNVSTL